MFVFVDQKYTKESKGPKVSNRVLSGFFLLLLNHLANWNQTLKECSFKMALFPLCGSTSYCSFAELSCLRDDFRLNKSEPYSCRCIPFSCRSIYWRASGWHPQYYTSYGYDFLLLLFGSAWKKQESVFVVDLFIFQSIFMFCMNEKMSDQVSLLLLFIAVPSLRWLPWSLIGCNCFNWFSSITAWLDVHL